MECQIFTVLVEILIVTSPDVFRIFSETSQTSEIIYVTPSKSTLYPNEPKLYHTLQEYASEPERYFANNTVFYFYCGVHRLEDNLRLKYVYNISFRGLLTNNGVVNILMESLASITWEKSWNVEISSINFILLDNFTFILRFEQSLLFHLSNISIFGNGYRGCSSIMSHESEVDINNSTFNGINGFLGAAIMMMASNITFRGNNVFVNNTAASGGSIYLSDSMLTMNGTSLFLNNTSSHYSEELVNWKMSRCNYRVEKITKYIGSGGAIFCSISYMRVCEHTNFSANSAKFTGGALSVDSSNLFIQGNTEFSWNRAGDSGGALLLKNTSSHISGNLSINKNEAEAGGAIVIAIGNLSIQGFTLFEENTAKDQGGAVHLVNVDFEFCGHISFVNNTAGNYRGGALYMFKSKALFDDKCFTKNTVTVSSITFVHNIGFGGSLYCWYSSSIKFIGTMHFNESYKSAIRAYHICNISFVGTTHFYRNTGFDLDGGAIDSSDSSIAFLGTVHFERNWAIRGGAVFMEGTSKLILKPELSISFILNHANDSGGAIYFSDSQCSLGLKIECFIIIEGPLVSTSNISLHFKNNSAEITGSILYGGQLDKCRLFFRNTSTKSDQCNCRPPEYSDNALETLINMSNITQNKDSVLNISSPAKVIKFCAGNSRHRYLNLYPGQKFDISLIALGQAGYPVPTTIFWETILKNHNGNVEYRLSPFSRTMESSCTNVSFQLHSTGSADVEFKLYPKNSCQNLVKGLTLRIHMLPCPIGFDLSYKDSRCVCDKKLKKFTQNCYTDSNSESVERVKNNFWIFKLSNQTLILHEYRCPLDYCTNDPLNVSLSEPYVQCDFNRNGTLCGQCQESYSLALGSLHCIQCDNNHAALIILFALAGVAVIGIIFLLHLTVAVGTLNGLYFYANIIQANHQAFFPRATINFFTGFISWLNLDLGIETCFYDGMDIYVYSWFQFLFPFYVWLLVGCIIFACHYFQLIAKRLGQNPVAVLATLLLMSFSTVLQAIIVPLSFTHLTYYNSDNESHQIIWLYEGSIEYLKGPKHIALGVFAIISLVAFVLPYISLLLFGQWLQGCSNWWILSWLNKLKPFMDAYHAPYKKHTRYWTGLLLLSRLGLFLTFAINANGSESVNLLAVSSVTIALLTIKLLRVYENLYKDILESSFILNLGIFSVATFYVKEESRDDDSQLILSSISVGIAFITFTGILLFYISLVLKSSSIWKVHMLPFIQKSLLLSKILRITPVIKNKNIKGNKDAAELQALPTSTEIDVDLREPLLEITESQVAT